LFPSVGGYILKNTKDNIKKIFVPIIPMGAIRYCCPIQLFPTYILPAKERRLLGKFQPDSFITERQVCVETDGHNLISNIDPHLPMATQMLYRVFLWAGTEKKSLSRRFETVTIDQFEILRNHIDKDKLYKHVLR